VERKNNYQEMCVRLTVTLLGKLREQQRSPGLRRKGSANLMNEGSVRMSIMKMLTRTMEENKLKRVTDEAKKEYLESICDEIRRYRI